MLKAVLGKKDTKGSVFAAPMKMEMPDYVRIEKAKNGFVVDCDEGKQVFNKIEEAMKYVADYFGTEKEEEQNDSDTQED